jgi:hypothetical protein
MRILAKAVIILPDESISASQHSAFGALSAFQPGLGTGKLKC